MMFQDDLVHEMSELRYEVRQLIIVLGCMQATFIAGVIIWMVG